MLGLSQPIDIVRSGGQGQVEHLRTVVTPSKTLEAVLELHEVDLKDKGIRHRLMDKQSTH